ncbi:MAG: BrnA antitoxin family protein [Solobacterium sp.]|nr:BrnA antitoxin family protein [Solobacterium sp.]
MKDNNTENSGAQQPGKKTYPKRQKKTITLNLSASVIDYFKDMAGTSGIPYQTLINMYLEDCVINNKMIDVSWR